MSKHACHIIKWRLISKKILKTLYVHSNTVHRFCVQLYSWFVCIYFNSPLLSGLLRWVELSNVVFRLLRCQRAAGGFRECQHSDPSWSPLPPPQQSARHRSSEPWGFSGEALLNHELVYVQKSTSTWMKDLISYAFSQGLMLLFCSCTQSFNWQKKNRSCWTKRGFLCPTTFLSPR